MFELEAAATEWLRPEADANWSWDAACEVVVWSDGSTLLFREELVQILDRLLPNRVPASGVLFLLLAAAKGKIIPPPETDAETKAHLQILGRLAAFPPALLSGIAAKAQLIEYYTEGLAATPREEALEIVRILRGGLPVLPLFPDITGEPGLATHLAQLGPLLRRKSMEELRHRLETGLDAAPEPAALEPTAKLVAALLQELAQESEFAGLVRLVHDLMAAISLPRLSATPDVTALGGLSDISNRGPLHRLLASELAHDHDVLTLRLAMNEALYLRNEPPAATPLSELIVLVDSGIRLWGAPRVFATAAALALLARVPKHQTAQAFRAQAKGIATADLTNKAGLTKHLAALELNEHPGSALHQLARDLKDSQRTDLVVITHGRALEDAAFRLPVKLPDKARVYLVTVDREGHIAMFLATPQGHRLLKEAHVSLSALVTGQAPAIVDPHSRLPAIFQAQPFPFLLVPMELIAEFNLATQNLCAGVSRTGAIWTWESTKKGARQLPLPPVPGTPILFVHDETVWGLLLLTYTPDKLHLVIHGDEPIETTDVYVFDDIPCKPTSTFRRNGLLHVLYKKEADIIDLRTGSLVARAELPSSLEKIGEGFYRRNSMHGILRWNQKFDLELLRLPPNVGFVRCAFHREGMEGPWIIDAEGNVVQTCTPFTRFKINLEKNGVPKVSPDGHEIELPSPVKGQHLVVSIKNNLLDHPDATVAHPWYQPPAAPHWSMRRNFTHIAFTKGGQLALLSGKGRWVTLQLDNRGKALTFHPIEQTDLDHPTRMPFQPFPAPSFHGATLEAAVWPGGSHAFLDSRGLLHLQSADLKIPEVSLVLAESNSIPAWSSDGCLIGPGFFLAQEKQGDIKSIDSSIRRFVEAIR